MVAPKRSDLESHRWKPSNRKQPSPKKFAKSEELFVEETGPPVISPRPQTPPTSDPIGVEKVLRQLAKGMPASPRTAVPREPPKNAGDAESVLGNLRQMPPAHRLQRMPRPLNLEAKTSLHDVVAVVATNQEILRTDLVRPTDQQRKTAQQVKVPSRNEDVVDVVDPETRKGNLPRLQGTDSFSLIPSRSSQPRSSQPRSSQPRSSQPQEVSQLMTSRISGDQIGLQPEPSLTLSADHWSQW